MNTKPLALFLADALESSGTTGVQMVDAAYELRRLHAANIDCMNHFNALMDERNDLLEALRFCAGTSYIDDAHRVAQAAIAKATGESK